MKTTTLLTSLAAAGALALPAAAVADERPVPDYPEPPPARTHASDASLALKSHSTQELRMRIAKLGEDRNALGPCFGFEIIGSGVNVAASEINTFGPVFPEPSLADRPDGGIPGAVKQPDGTFVLPESSAVVDADSLVSGRQCQAAGWDFFGADGRAKPEFHAVATRARAAKARSSARKRLKRAQSEGVKVLLAGITRRADGGLDMVVRVKTGKLGGPVTLSTHARVVLQ